MKTPKIAALYSILLGFAMLGMWIMLLITGQVPEIETEPIYLTYHLIAEFLTAFALIIGGFGLMKNYKWGLQLYLLSMGMLLYAVLIAGGYYAQKNDIAMIMMFTVLIILSLFFIVSVFHNKFSN